MLQNQTVTPQPGQRNTSPVRATNVARREPTPEEIRLRAFQLYEKRNREPGHETEDWLQAERELRERNPR